MLSLSSYTPVVITAIRVEVPGVKTFTLSYADGPPIAYRAGQFITFVFQHHGREERRSFSISSCPDTGEPLSITVKRVDNGAYSRLLTDKAQAGDMLYTTGVAGLFVLPADMSSIQQVFLFAAGIGITPVFSLLKSLLTTQPATFVTLIYSNRVAGEVAFFNELEELRRRFPSRLAIEYLMSTSFNLARARLNKALVPILLQEYSRVPPVQQLFYICGPYTYMRMVIYALEEHGIKDEQIRKENFNTDERTVTVAAPPDKDPHQVTLVHNGERRTITVQFPETILQAAQRNGIALPYSCEAGRCGSCAARCLQGKVWLSYNEVLMDTDLKHGSILTCTGYPVGGDVEIDV